MASGQPIMSAASTTSHPPPLVEEVVVTTPTSTATVVPPPVIATNAITAGGISQEAYRTETSGQTAHGAQPAVAAASGTKPSTSTGPVTAIRNFFKRLFSSNTPRQTSAEKQTGSTTVTASATAPQLTDTTTTSATKTVTTVASTNLPPPS